MGTTLNWMTFWVHALPKRLFVLWLRNTKFSKLFPNGHSFCQQRNTKFDFYYQFSLLSETWIWDILFRVLTFGKRNTYLWIPNLFTAWKLSVFGVILIGISPHSDWIRRVSLRIQSGCGKMRTRVTPNTDTFWTVILIQWKTKSGTLTNFEYTFWQKWWWNINYRKLVTILHNVYPKPVASGKNTVKSGSTLKPEGK